jgi:hypothetical protein
MRLFLNQIKLAPAGSLVVWICGLVHDARTHLSKFKPGFGELRRLNSYICLAPRMFLQKGEAEARLKVFQEGSVRENHILCLLLLLIISYL